MFIKITEEKDTTIYPAVTFEDANTANEQLYYDDAGTQITSRPGSFYTSTTNGSKVQLLRKSVQSKGAGKLLKVMAGDKLDIKVDYYIASATTDNSTANGLNTIINALGSIIPMSMGRCCRKAIIILLGLVWLESAAVQLPMPLPMLTKPMEEVNWAAANGQMEVV